jgi:hypothetical protein
VQPRMNEVRRVEERPLSELFSDLVTETSNLVRNEVALAKVEITNKASKIGKNIGSLVIGGAVAYAGVLAVGAAVIMLLGRVIPMWLSALIVGLIVVGIAWLMISKAMTELQRVDLKPEATVESVKEDAQWIKDQIS